MKLVVLLVCFLLSICATVTSLMAWKGMHEISTTPPLVVAPPLAPPPPRANTQELESLTVQVANLRSEVSALKEAVATAATAASAPTPAGAAAPLAAIDDAKLKDMIRSEMQNQFRMMRGGFNRDDPATIQRLLQEQLALDPAKATQVAAMVSSERAAVRAIYQNGNGASREELAPKIKEERDKLDSETAKVLSADEQAKLDTWLDRAQNRRQRPDPNATPGGAPAGGQAAAVAPGTATTPPATPSSF